MVLAYMRIVKPDINIDLILYGDMILSPLHKFFKDIYKDFEEMHGGPPLVFSTTLPPVVP